MSSKISSTFILTLASGLVLSLAACSSSEEPADKPKNTAQATGDAGVAPASPDSGVTVGPRTNGDAGVTTGGGAMGPCSPITGSGCAGEEQCALQLGRDEGACVLVSNPKAFEAPCDMQAQDCDRGLVCGQIQGEAGPSCKKVCNAHNSQGCEGLRGASENYACAILPQGASNFAICAGVGANCEPQNDTCPNGQTCAVTSQTTSSCVPAGDVALGGDCGEGGQCARGGICVNIGAGAKCYDACDPNNTAAPGCTDSMGVCTGLQGLSWGICFVPECSPFSDPCAAGQVCSGVAGSTSCVPAGPTPIGGNCGNAACADGFCVNIGMGPTCYETCNMNTACTAGQCGMLQGLDYGICVN